mgnify:CR=1 FL=1
MLPPESIWSVSKEGATNVAHDHGEEGILRVRSERGFGSGGFLLFCARLRKFLICRECHILAQRQFSRMHKN